LPICPQAGTRRGRFPVESTGQVWRGFWRLCPPKPWRRGARYNFYCVQARLRYKALWEQLLSQVTSFEKGTGAVSRWKLGRSQIIVTVQELVASRAGIRVQRYADCFLSDYEILKTMPSLFVMIGVVSTSYCFTFNIC
jgi:hypothetical protein